MKKYLACIGLLISLSIVSVSAAPILYRCHGEVKLSDVTFTSGCQLRTLKGKAAFTSSSSTYSYSVQLYDDRGVNVASGGVNVLNKNREVYYNINVLFGNYSHAHKYDKYLN